MDAFPIAIVGIGCRFPGKVNSPEDFWRMLCDGRDAIGPFPAGRFDVADVFDSDRTRPGKMYVSNGGFIEGVDQFDAAFFGISPREAAVIDPQHRLLLEVSYEALEDAGIALERIAGGPTGVFIGASTHDYGDVQMYPGNRGQIGSHSNSGTATSIVANRLSYIYDLRGPSMAVDTACSSALTAAHLACQSLLRGECDLALVGGVHLVLTPEPTIGFCKANMLSPDERCHAFDAAANGYVRSEGVGVVVLKPLAAAMADGDAVYAVIKATAINQDGHTNGMTVPSQDAQAAMLRLALDRAGLGADNIDYVEAHGTGTPVGDPIEAGAIGAVLGRNRSNRPPCVIGSVKTNIGHLEAASGIAGLIKATLAVAHRQIPPSLHFTTPNPAIDFARLGLRVATKLEAWPQDDRAATAGVNSFGFGGANAHIILQEAPETGIATEPPAPERAELLLLSARSAEALTATGRAYLDFLAGKGDSSLADICGSAALRRSHHVYRAATVAASHEDMIEAVDSLVAGERRAETIVGRASGEPGKVAFVFGGMGPQWWGMGRQLMRDEPVFNAIVDQCDALLQPIAGWSLLDVLFADESSSRVAEANVAQVTNFAIQAALAALWRSWGIVPDAVIGHSAGGIAASHIAGVHDLADTVLLAYHRSRLQSRASGQGTMLAVGLGAEAAQEAGAGYADRVWLAAVNSPTSCALSGDADALEEIRVDLQKRGVFARMLQVAVPYHSARMDPIREELLDALGLLKARPAQIGLVSDVTGTWVDGTGYGAGYWWQTVRQPVRFAEGIATLIDAGFDTFVELSPHPVLSNSVNECLAAKGRSGQVLPSLRRQDDDRKVMLRSLAALAVQGHAVHWAAVQSGFRHYTKLPTYAWQHERHWFESQARGGEAALARRRAEGEHPLLGARLHAATPLWEAILGPAVRGWLDDHIVAGTVVFPAAAYVEMAIAVAAAVMPDRAVSVRDLGLSRALFLSAGREPLVQTVLDHDNRLTIHSAPGDADSSWTLHASARIEWTDPPAPPVVAVAELRPDREIDQSQFYRSLTERGLLYSRSFTGIDHLWQGDGTALGHLDIGALGLAPEPYRIHPALLDAAFQVLIAAASGAGDSAVQKRQLLVPVHIDAVVLHRSPGAGAWSHARVIRREAELLVGDVDIRDDDGTVCATIRGLRCAPLAGQRSETEERVADWLYEFRWEREDRAVGGLPLDAAAAAAGVQATADARSVASGWQRYYTEVEPLLEGSAVQLAADAFRTLGWDAEPGTSFRTDDLIESLRIVPKSAALSRRLLLILADHGILAPEDGSWRVQRELPRADTQTLAKPILEAHPAYAVDLNLILRCGGALAAVMRGEADAREVLFGADSLADLTRFYREAPASAYYGALLADAVATTADRAGGAVRILEIGGGTGGVTAPLLASVPADCEYLFTDVSPLFVTRAVEQFGNHAGFTARVLDIEHDPAAQGFATHSADIVVAANVLHATADLGTTLAHVRSLLAPGGLLVLLEITRKPRWLDIVFGVAEGWWKFRDYDLRPDHPLLDPAQWTALLQSQGFAAVSVIADSDHPGSPGQAVIVARSEDRRAAGTWLLFGDTGGIADRLRHEIERRGGEMVLARPAGAFRQIGRNEFAVRPDDAEDIGHVLEALGDGPLRGAVMLSALDAKSGDAMALLAAQNAVCDAPIAALAALRRARAPALWLVTAGATPAGEPATLAVAQAPLWGLARVMMREQAELRCRLVDLDASCSDAALAAFADEIAADGGDEEVAFRDGQRWVHRLARLDEVTHQRTRAPVGEEGWQIEAAVPGALATIAARAVPRRAPGPSQVEIAVTAAGLNFRDVMLAAGMIPSLATDQTFGEQGLGLDCAGHVVRCGSEVSEFAPGGEVIAIAPHALGAFVTTDVGLVARKPHALTFETGAALPCAFVTAHYALDRLARLGRGERVLIHAATGGVGLAAIQIARRAGAEIFATAGSPEKRAYLQSLGIRQVMDSRSLAFADQILEMTNGEGVDVVLNSLAGEAIPKGIGILRPYGRFVEIGKRDIYGDSRIGLLPFRKNISFFAVDLDRLCNERPELAGEMLREIVEGFETGVYTALPQQVFPASQAEDAVRLMAQARHIGKIVLQTADPELKIAAPGAAIHPEGTYLITGGLGGFGLATARWLVQRGARSIALMGRRTAGPAAQTTIATMRAEGATVEVYQGDVARLDDVRRILDEIRAGGPLRGVVHCAMVLDDAPLTEMSPERMRNALAPKMAGAWNLHVATSNDPLDLFVLYSSLVAVIGNPLQANYAAANTFLDALAHHRRAVGLPALAVQWGVIADAGYVAQHAEVGEYLSRQGYESFTADQALDAMGYLIERDAGEAVVARIDWRRLADYSPATSASSSFRRFAPAVTAEAAPTTRSGSVAAIAGIADPGERLAAIEEYLRDKIGKVLGMNPQRVDADKPLTEIGLDSLIAVELVTTLKLELGFELPVVKLLQGLALSGLATLIAQALPAEPLTPPTVTAQPPVPVAILDTPPPADPAAGDTASVAPVPLPIAAPVIAAPVAQRWTTAQQLARWCAQIGFAVGARVAVTGLEHIPPSGGLVLASNHLSFLDVPAVLSIIPRPVVLMAAEWLQANPAFRWVLGDIGQAIFVRRGEGDGDALEAAVAVLSAGGIIGIGPEGGINRGGGLRPGLPGAAYLATSAGVPVVPIALWGQERVIREWRRLRRPEINIAIGAPLTFPYGAASAVDLRRHTDQIMRAIAALLPSGYRGLYAEVTQNAA